MSWSVTETRWDMWENSEMLTTEKDLKYSFHSSAGFSHLFCFLLHSVCYDRAPWYPTALTFVLSALWHGIYPGYYFTFLTGILITLAARAVCTFCCSLPRPSVDALQLSTAGTTLALSSSLSLLWALCPAFAGVDVQCNFVNANYQVSQQLVSTNFVCATMLPLAVRESIAWVYS